MLYREVLHTHIHTYIPVIYIEYMYGTYILCMLHIYVYNCSIFLHMYVIYVPIIVISS